MPPRKILLDEEECPHEVVKVGGFDMEIRSETHGVDLGWLRYVIEGNRYWSHVTPQVGQTWLDVGAFLGGFSVVAARQGATVHAFEPGPVTFDMLRRNVERNGLLAVEGEYGGVHCHNAALTMHREPTTSLFLNPHRKKAAHSMYVRRGRREIQVPARHADDVVRELGITHIKSDSEGAEWDVFMGLSDEAYDQLQEVTFTYHRAMLHDRKLERYRQLLDRLKSHFPIMTYRDPDTLGGNWTVNVHAQKC